MKRNSGEPTAELIVPPACFLFITAPHYDRLLFMYTLPVILFCAGVILGGLHGYFLGTGAVDLIFSIAVGGFLGSAMGGAAFIYMYMFRQRPRPGQNG